MPYTDPSTVTAPKAHWSLEEVVCDTGKDGWSVAKGHWDKGAVVAVRWNGGDAEGGNPNSHGNPTWFILPDELGKSVVAGLAHIRHP